MLENELQNTEQNEEIEYNNWLLRAKYNLKYKNS